MAAAAQLNADIVQQTHTAVLKHKLPEFTPINDAQTILTAERDRPVILCLVSTWSVLSRASVQHLHAASAGQRERVLFIDQDEAREFCDSNDIALGSATIMVFKRGEAVQVPGTSNIVLPVRLTSTDAATKLLDSLHS